VNFRFPAFVAGQESKFTSFCLFIYLLFFESPEQFFSYLVTVTITGDRAANFRPMLSAYSF
jgi:hypothetical protein